MRQQVLGLGIAGQAAARLLRAQGHEVLAWDEKNSDRLQQIQQELEPEGILVRLGEPFQLQAGVEQVVVSPGIRWDHPLLEQARQKGIAVLGEAELAWQSLDFLPWVGITGTNGKSTTTALIAEMVQAAGLKGIPCGNIGLPLCQVALDTLRGERQPDWIVAELSSYQLEASTSLMSSSPSGPARIGVWTTFTPDHLERHGTLERYASFKARLVDRATWRVLNGEDPYLLGRKQDWPNTYWICTQDQSAPVHLRKNSLWIQAEPIAELEAFGERCPGHHNLQNLLMAATAAHLAGIPNTAIQQAIRSFAGMPHRLERVAQLHIGPTPIRFVNDSKATNYDAAWVGLNAVEPPILLIAGGKAKQGDAQAWLNLIQTKVARVLLIGEAAPAFAAALDRIHYTGVELVQTLDVAVVRAFEAARSLAQTLTDPTQPITVLFSPACASFDQYRSFEHRGDHFRTCCQALQGSLACSGSESALEP
ncbi:UDP-N-acetylmuramoyl-L-alanine--D-glutamate ligase [Synechococcus sp. Nb3U1]|uniref:UDP-N-acetylmuramoyl-L-alanine--D-glutamate ligase n=1 Tax=Synechococcus sp. Nb3U1 TaxID=1914529 RepID=UPI001F487148|nr:UDP-N-acetylmuramoyl-L-alanine--D-glutamate ligase [Synechococcus sp. Nb3U1]MCF2971690.1 UDP-N-acetylmuramoyl-L-alanine--D-glutamate ligase [Synechococcus sp. Nb3U1]